MTGWQPNNWRYTARPEWSSDGESMWMRLSKFSLCNRLSVTALGALFALDSDGDSMLNVDLRRADRWNVQALAMVLEIAVDEVRAGFCGESASRAVSQQLRYCPACLQFGFHAVWFQSLHIERCPLHRLRLGAGCRQCAAPVPYAIGHALASHPLQCARCGIDWVPALSRPAGRCLPLDRRSARLLCRWGRYVAHLTAEECPSPQTRDEGRFAAAAAPSPVARPHPLTLVNRLFDAPPPMTWQLLARRSPRCCEVTRPIVTARPVAAYDRTQWPHFGRRFAQCEQVLRDAWLRLFGTVQQECEAGRWRPLLTTGLTASCASMDSSTAAALGWTIAWTSPVQALAPSPQSAIPALGLAAWLASLPLRPPHMPKQRWHAQVLQWLHEDLELSAWVWARIAAFMQAKGHYVLHGAMAHPRELALLRCEGGDTGGIFTSNTMQLIGNKRIF